MAMVAEAVGKWFWASIRNFLDEEWQRTKTLNLGHKSTYKDITQDLFHINFPLTGLYLLRSILLNVTNKFYDNHKHP